MSTAQPVLPLDVGGMASPASDGTLNGGRTNVAKKGLEIPGISHLPRILKLTAAVSVVGIGAYGLIAQQHFISSSAAVVTAHITAIRSPIDGEVEGLSTAGREFNTGGVLAHVENVRANQERLADLSQTYSTAAVSARAAEAEQAALVEVRGRMLARKRAYALSLSARLESEATAQEEILAASEQSAAQADANYVRGKELFGNGILSAEALERLGTSDGVARKQTAAQRAALQTLKLEESAARRGISVEPGMNNDVVYSQQRVDDIDLRLAENARLLATASGQASEAGTNLDAQQAHASLMHGADLLVPAHSFLWRLDASNGEHLTAGDAVAEVVNCDEDLLLAAIPQNRVPDVLIGGEARIRLSGETMVRTGLVQAVIADPAEGDSRTLAALPLKNTEDRMATVRILLQPLAESGHGDGPRQCKVGRTASVMMPTTGSSPLTRWLHLYFR